MIVRCGLFVLLLSAPAAAAVQVHGTHEPFFASVADRGEIPARIDTLWTLIARDLRISETPDPIVYLYPFEHDLQPAVLNDLQNGIAGSIPGFKDRPDLYLRLFRPLAGITYDVTLFRLDDRARGRIIQINTARSYVSESGGERGYGIYLTAHEMMHFALNRRGIDGKYHHCLMIQEPGGRPSLLLRALDAQTARGWAGENLRARNPFAKGYGEEKKHCDTDVMILRKTEGPGAVEPFWNKIEELSAEVVP